ncbi:MAG: hypothetical protein JXA61_08785 [Bacteroidales bacterium]|nr:hypothetical protein [Bacteroidales bacterium]
MKKKNLIILGVLVVLILCAIFIWPTFYKKENINMGIIGTQTIRTHRFTGAQEIYGSGKWQPVEVSEDGQVSFPEDVEIEVW